MNNSENKHEDCVVEDVLLEVHDFVQKDLYASNVFEQLPDVMWCFDHMTIRAFSCSSEAGCSSEYTSPRGDLLVSNKDFPQLLHILLPKFAFCQDGLSEAQRL